MSPIVMTQLFRAVLLDAARKAGYQQWAITGVELSRGYAIDMATAFSEPPDSIEVPESLT